MLQEQGLLSMNIDNLESTNNTNTPLTGAGDLKTKGNIMQCSNEKCENEFNIDLNSLNCESNGSSGSHTTSYTYTGVVTCQICNTEHDVSINADECDDTDEILSID